MSDIILHHYPNSPFSEKIRLILGYKKLAWKSVIIPVIMPKPNVVALTGGYRRTPIMQIGADIYCDTALMADVLERIALAPTIYPKATEGLARTLAQWADSSLFWTMITHRFQPAGVQSALGGMTPEQIKAFTADRAAFRANVPRMPLAEATGTLKEYFRRLENMLAGGNAFLLGDEPGIADFSVYHSVWFLQGAPAVADVLDVAPRLKEWAARMAAFGHGSFDKMSAEAALDAARGSEAASTEGLPFVDYHGVALGERVAVMPSDYGIDPVEGDLVISTDNEFAVRRTDPQAGTVVVHFPRIGFQLKKA
jgi:glutathione S-transferase